MLDNKTTLGHLIYLQEHYEIAIYEVQVDKPVDLPTFNDRVHSGEDVFRLGRDADLDIKITHGNLAYDIPTLYERCHYMYFLRDASSLKLVCYISNLYFASPSYFLLTTNRNIRHYYNALVT